MDGIPFLLESQPTQLGSEAASWTTSTSTYPQTLSTAASRFPFTMIRKLTTILTGPQPGHRSLPRQSCRTCLLPANQPT